MVEIPYYGLASVPKFLPNLRRRPCRLPRRLHLLMAFRCSHSHCLHSFHLFLPAFASLNLLILLARAAGPTYQQPIYYLVIPFKAIRGVLPSFCWKFGYLQGQWDLKDDREVRFWISSAQVAGLVSVVILEPALVLWVTW